MPKAQRMQLVVQQKQSKPKPKATKLAAALQRLDVLTQRLPKGTFQRVGAVAGGVVAGPKGALVGGAIGRGVAAITGRGDYMVTDNSIIKSGFSGIDVSKDTLPQFNRSQHTVRVSHREYFANLRVPASGANYINRSFTLNPGNAELFPWLSTLAKQYQQYKIRGMVFEYKSNTSDYAAAGPLGAVGIATNYNINELPFQTLVQFENSEYAVVTKPSRDIIHAIECAPRTGRDDFLFVRDAGNIDPLLVSDPRFYDFGRVQVMTDGLPGNEGELLGQLWVSYDIEFTKPVIQASAAVPIPPSYLGTALTSHSDGTVSAAGDGDVQNYTYEAAGIVTPGVSTVYGLMDIAGATTTGIFSATVGQGAVSKGVNSAKLMFNRNGRWRLTFVVRGDTTAANYVLVPTTAPAVTFTVANNGTGVYTGFVQYGNRLAHVCSASTATYGYTSVIDIEFVTSGCEPGGTNNVVLDFPTFTTNSANLIQNLTRGLVVTWTARESVTILGDSA